MKIFGLILCLLSFNQAWANEFKKCKEAENIAELASSECTTTKVSLSYQDKSNQQINLFVRKFPSLKERVGSIWLVAGGPGESGANLYSLIDTFRQSFPNLDVFVPDHRGTGASSTICPEESINSVAGTSLVGEEWGTCFAHMYANLSYVQAFSITNAAKDLRQLIKSMSGSGKRYVYGVSYGTQLTLRLLQLGDIKLDGVILDSLVPLQDDIDFDLSKRSQVVDIVGRSLLKRCEESPECATKEEPNLQQQLIELTAKVQSIKDFSENLPQADLSIVLGSILDIPHLRKELPNIIRSLYKGDPKPLEKAVTEIDNYYSKFDRGYPNFGSSIPLVQVISSSENNLQLDKTKADVVNEAKKLLFTSPLPNHLAENSMPTYARDQFYAKLPSQLPKVLVLHGSLDPKTHFDGAKIHAEKLAKIGDLSFIEIEDAPHFIALNAPSCFEKYVSLLINSKPISKLLCRDESVLVKF